ncbi:PspC domain-containing protein [Dyadobacter luteus]|uniref:PspC domain-containing protein n=1 Tax=Dyadobacter luteus TaxID=2259619 RepID=A0A3D8YAD2_9BACT|nr:PspC domain-containing protein [Dyadobacter luteus]REA58725.1 PspC domain-containing protein [Dyadobacter luteus]
MNNNRLFRNTENKMIGGVASGLAEYLSIDVTVVRVLLVLAFFIPKPFPIVLIYIALWIVMPTKRSLQQTWEQGPTMP